VEKLGMSTARDLRERARRWRELSLGFSDQISRAVIEMAEEMESNAAKIEKSEADRPQTTTL
jgi:hypothetical protein